MTPVVSICITTYNRKHLLPFALRSIFNQTYRDFEVLLIDDHSSDGTQRLVQEELIGSFNDKLRYIRHDKNLGLAAARNTAIANARGKYFTFCDDDDEWLPEFLERFVEVAEKHDETWCFCCGSIDSFNKMELRYDIGERQLKDVIYEGYTPPVASQFYFLNTLKKVSGYNEEVKTGVDHDLWLSLSYKGIWVSFLPISLTMPNTNIDPERMTKDPKNRIQGIHKSLDIWKEEIIKHYGLNFYNSFYNAYEYYLTKVFTKKYIKMKNYKSLFNLFFQYGFYKYLLRLIKNTLKSFTKSSANIAIIEPQFDMKSFLQTNHNFK